MKKLIALQAVANSGKTTIIKKVFEELVAKKTCKIIERKYEHKKDLWVIIELDNTRIGIVSEGDLPECLPEYLKWLDEQKCEIIICACRSRGGTVNAIIKYKDKYEIIWIEIDHLDNPISNEVAKKNEIVIKKILKYLPFNDL